MVTNSAIEAFRVIAMNVSRRRKVQFIFLFLLVFLGGFAEVVSLGLIIPFLAVLIDPLQASQMPFVRLIVDMLDLTNINETRLRFTLFFIIAGIVAGIVRFVLMFSIAKFNFGLGSDLGIKIYQYSLYQPYEKHTSQNSSEIIGGLNKIDQFVWVSFGLITMISCILMAIFIGVFLIIYDPILAVSAFIGLAILYVTIFVFARKRLDLNSEAVAHSSNKRIQIIQEGLGGIRDVILTRTQDLFIRYFSIENNKMYQAHASNNILGPSPRFAIEALGLVLISLFAYFSVSSGKEITSTIAMLGVLALSAQRLLPLVRYPFRRCIGHLPPGGRTYHRAYPASSREMRD